MENEVWFVTKKSNGAKGGAQPGKGTALRVATMALAALVALALTVATVWHGALNQDEGWYLYAAKQVARGLRPYRDFFFTQGPLLPWVYGMFHHLWYPFGILGGRIFTTILGLASTVLAACLAASDFPRDNKGSVKVTAFAASLTTFLLLAVNPYHVYFTTIPKTYALSALCLVGGVWAVDTAIRRKRSVAAALVGGFLMASAASARLSLGAALPVAGIWMLVIACRRRSGHAKWILFGVGGLAGLALFFFQPLHESFDAFRFANSFHTARAGGGLVYALGSVARLARGYIALAGITVAALLLLAVANPKKRRAVFSGDNGPMLWLACFAAIFIVHLASPYPYDDYQTPVMPLFAAAASVIFWRLAVAAAPYLSGRTRGSGVLFVALLAWTCVTAATSPLLQDWVMLWQDRFWAVKKTQSDLAMLREIGREIKGITDPTQPLLTQDLYVAIEADRDVPPGFEMGPFGFFPDLPDDEAAKMHVLNRNGALREIREGRHEFIVTSGYTFAIAAPAMTEYVDCYAMFNEIFPRYDVIGGANYFGQGHTTLSIMRLNHAEQPATIAKPAN